MTRPARTRTRHVAARWHADQEGSLTTEASILFPLLFATVFFVIQFALFFYGDMAVEQAAQHGLRAVTVGQINGNPQAVAVATDAVDEFLTTTGGVRSIDTLQASSDGRYAAVTLTAEPPWIFPFFRELFGCGSGAANRAMDTCKVQIEATAEGPVERFVPADERR